MTVTVSGDQGDVAGRPLPRRRHQLPPRRRYCGVHPTLGRLCSEQYPPRCGRRRCAVQWAVATAAAVTVAVAATMWVLSVLGLVGQACLARC